MKWRKDELAQPASDGSEPMRHNGEPVAQTFIAGPSADGVRNTTITFPDHEGYLMRRADYEDMLAMLAEWRAAR